MRHKTGSYEIETKRINGPAEPELWYWTLYRDGMKINGGTADSEENALYLAGSNKRKDSGETPGFRPRERL